MSHSLRQAAVDLMRHGETVDGAVFRGRRDDPLTPAGWAQMEQSYQHHGPWQRIVSSPLQRCLAPARRWAERDSLPLRIDERLREMDFGAWEGRRAAELMASDGAALMRFWQDPFAHPPPGGEPLAACRARVLEGWNAAWQEAPEEPLLVVTHGGPIRLILWHLRAQDADAQCNGQSLLSIPVSHACLYRVAPAPTGQPTPPLAPAERAAHAT